MSLAGSLARNATIAAAVGQPLATQAWRVISGLSPETDAARRDSGPVTPADGAFAIWGPLFVSSVAHAVVLSRSAGDDIGLIRSWSLAAFALNGAWSVNAQSGPLKLRSLGLLLGVAGSAVTSLLLASASDRSTSGQAADTIGGLAGWLSVAAFAHLETTANALGERPMRESEDRRAMALVAGASAAAAGLAWSSRGNLPFAAAAGWGLGGVAWRAGSERRRGVRAAALIGLGAVVAATLLARGR